MRTLWPVITSTVLFAIFSNLAFAESAKESQKAKQENLKELQGETGTGGVKSKDTPLPPGDPCSVIPLSDIKKLLPKVTKAARDSSLEHIGIVRCVWSGKDGVILGLVQSSLEPDSALTEARSTAQGFVDLTKPGSVKNVRMEAFPGIGIDNAAFVEFLDPKRSIVGNVAALFLANGKVNLMLMTSDIQGLDRAAVLKSLQELGRLGARSLK